MRILASNPDTIGDMVLRQPMYRALREAGHELMLIVRPSVAPLIEYVAPGAATIVLPTEVYRDDLEQHWPLFAELFAAARDFQPDALLVAPFQWTQFEERLSDELKDLAAPLRRFGMSGRLYAGDPHLGRAPASRLTFDVTAAVDEDLPEIEKNAALAAAVLGQLPAGLQIEPRIDPGDATLQDARQDLDKLSLAPGDYWVACVTGTVHVPIKAWQLENWARLLSHWVRNHNRQFLFIGLPEERQAVDEVRRLMGDAADRTRVFMNDNAALSHLIGLTAHSSGYAGHDTGPMHLAAALGKPVLAVFGGGHKLRFVPRGADGAPSVIVTVGVPCAGCAWTCPFKVSHCVRDVPVEQVISAADDLEAGRIAASQPRVLPPDAALRDRMIGEAAAFAREQLRDTGERGRQLREQQELTILPLQAALDNRSREAEALAEKLDQQQTRATELGARFERLTRESANLAGNLKQKEQEADKFLTELALRTREAEELRRSASVRDLAAERLRKQVAELELAAASRDVEGAFPARRRTMLPLAPVSWGQIVSDFFTGQRHYVPRRSPRPLPKITLITPIPSGLSCDCPDCGKGGVRNGQAGSACRSADVAAVRATIESVLAQGYPRLEYILAPVGEAAVQPAPAWLEPYASRLTWMTQASPGPFEAMTRAFDSCNADVVGWLEAGDLLEPGAMQNVGEFFRDHPRSSAAAFDQIAEVCGWLGTCPRPQLDVVTLLKTTTLPGAVAASGHLLVEAAADPESHGQASTPGARDHSAVTLPPGSAFVRRQAYRAIGQFDKTKGRAAGWYFLMRVARRHGFDCPGTDVARRRPRPPGSNLLPLPLWQATELPLQDALAAWHKDLNAAREAIKSTLGPAAQLRGWLVRRGHSVRDSVRRLLGHDRLVFPLAPKAAQAPADSPACHERSRSDVSTIQSPSSEDLASISPLTGRPPTRLIFSAPAPAGPIYHDAAGDLAYTTAAPPLTTVIDQPSPWPFAKHRPLNVWERSLVYLPCPRPWPSSTSDARNQSGRLLSVLAGLAIPNTPNVSFLHAACGEGQLLRQLRPAVRWALGGVEPDSKSAARARADGVQIWDIDPFAAATMLPLGRVFDVIFLDDRLPRAGDLLTTLRRLRQLLKPGGRIVLAGPNLNSRLLDLFGPTWPGWQLDRPLTVPGKRGVSKIACMADLRLTHYRTFTTIAASIKAVQQHRLGRTAVPSPDLPTENDRRRGCRMTAWANLLWDWRGKGDSYYAVME